MILPNFTFREKRIAFITLMVIACCIVFNQFIYPQIIYWKRVNKEIEKLNVDLLKARRALGLKDQVEEKYKNYQEKVLITGSDEEETAKLLREIENLSRPIGLYILNMKPLPVEDEGLYKRYSIQLEGDGEIITIAKFLYSIQTSPSFLKVQRLQMNARSGTKLLRANLFITKISVVPEKGERREDVSEEEKKVKTPEKA